MGDGGMLLGGARWGYERVIVGDVDGDGDGEW